MGFSFSIFGKFFTIGEVNMHFVISEIDKAFILFFGQFAIEKVPFGFI